MGLPGVVQASSHPAFIGWQAAPEEEKRVDGAPNGFDPCTQYPILVATRSTSTTAATATTSTTDTSAAAGTAATTTATTSTTATITTTFLIILHTTYYILHTA